MFIRRIGDCESVSWWLGRAWHDTLRAQMVCAPIPFNLVLAFARAAWLWVRFRHVTAGMIVREAYLAGYRRAMDDRGKVSAIDRRPFSSWKNHGDWGS